MIRENQLGYLDDAQRLEAYNSIVSGCTHLWSKNKLQEDKLEPVLKLFSELAEKDPLFLAHFTSYAMRKLDSKDLKVVAAFASSLSDADGTAFSVESNYRKPNWRLVAQAALQQLDPKLVLRVVRLANRKQKFGSKGEATHFSKHLRTALKRYLRFREVNPKVLEGVKRVGLSKTYKTLYRIARLAPSAEACKVLGWKQKEGYPGAGVEIKKNELSLEGLTDLQIAEKIRAERLPPTRVLGALPGKISPVVAAAILEQSTGDQAIILTDMFEEQGLLKNKEVQKLYRRKILSSKNALDRVDRIKSELSADTEAMLKTARAEKRKDDVGDVGKLFLHIDISGSMQNAIALASDRGATLAEFVKNPQENFHWGVFNDSGRILQKPNTFEKDAFKACLYGVRAGGGTNCLALYKQARAFGCDTDIYITDQGHTYGDFGTVLDQYTRSGIALPKLVVIVDVNSWKNGPMKEAFERRSVPVVMLTPKELAESALVSQAVKVALKGQTAIIEEILNESLLDLPKWWYSLEA